MTGVIGLGLAVSNQAFVSLMAVPNELNRADAPTRTVRDTSWSSDGRNLFVRSLGNHHPCDSVTIHEIENASGPVFNYCETTNSTIYDASLSSDGSHMLVATASCGLKWIDIVTLEEIEIALPAHAVIDTTALSHDGRLGVASEINGNVWLISLTTGASMLLDSQPAPVVEQLSFSEDDRRLLISRRGGTVEVWNVETCTCLRRLVGNRDRSVATFLPGGSRVLSSINSDYVQIWDLETGRTEWCQNHGLQGDLGVCTIDASSDGALAAWAGLDHRLLIWDLKHGRKRFEIANPGVITHVRFSPDGKLLAVSGVEKLIRLYNTETGRESGQVDSTPQYDI